VSRSQTRARAFARGLTISLLASLAVFNAAAAPAPADVDALLKAAEIGDLQPLQAAGPTIETPGPRALVDARLHIARFDEKGAARQLARYFASGDEDSARQAVAWLILADIAFAQGDYARAAKGYAEWGARLAGDDPKRNEAAQDAAIARALTGAPRQTILRRHPVPVAMPRDRAGLLAADAAINGHAQTVIVDTGADLSVLSISAARRLGVRIRKGASSIHSGTREAVPVRLGLAARVDFAGFRLAHVVFLVLEDANLAFPQSNGVYQIDAILGIPVLRAMGRVQFTGDGRFAPEPAFVAPAEGVADLRVIGSHLFVTARLGGIETPLHFDTGATDTTLTAAFAARHPEVLKGLPLKESQTGGAGGGRTEQVAVWSAVPVEIGGRSMVLPSLEISTRETPGSPPRWIAQLGGDILDAFCGFTLDFRRADIELGAPRASGTCDPKRQAD
jgi:predicted aspartyl protease